MLQKSQTKSDGALEQIIKAEDFEVNAFIQKFVFFHSLGWIQQLLSLEMGSEFCVWLRELWYGVKMSYGVKMRPAKTTFCKLYLHRLLDSSD